MWTVKRFFNKGISDGCKSRTCDGYKMQIIKLRPQSIAINFKNYEYSQTAGLLKYKNIKHIINLVHMEKANFGGMQDLDIKFLIDSIISTSCSTPSIKIFNLPIINSTREAPTVTQDDHKDFFYEKRYFHFSLFILFSARLFSNIKWIILHRADRGVCGWESEHPSYIIQESACWRRHREVWCDQFARWVLLSIFFPLAFSAVPLNNIRAQYSLWDSIYTDIVTMTARSCLRFRKRSKKLFS